MTSSSLNRSAAVALARFLDLQTIALLELFGNWHERLKQDGVPDGTHALPVGAVLEIAAISQLKMWEILGLRELLPADLPTPTEAIAEFYRLAKEQPAYYRSGESTPLYRKVVSVWWEHFAWAAPDLLGADVVLGDLEEDAWVDVLAELLWRNRH